MVLRALGVGLSASFRDLPADRRRLALIGGGLALAYIVMGIVALVLFAPK